LQTLCCEPPVLAFYNVHKPVEIQCDASKDGLGAVLLQEDRPIAYTSRSLTETEKRYAQIEKEALSIVHAATKFHCYIFGKNVTVYNDHKPLEDIFKKPILSAPMRLQKMILKLQWYDLEVTYRKGRDMQLADTLSRAYLPYSKSEVDDLEHVSMIDMISVSKPKYAEIQARTQEELHSLYEITLEGWPDIKDQTTLLVRPFWDSRDQLAVCDGVIYKGLRIVVPPSLQKQMLDLIHESHLGIVKCKQRAREVLYWPGMNSDIETIISHCAKCAEHQNKQPAEPLQPTNTPDLPFIEVGCDHFEFQSKHYLVLVDYYSKFIEVVALRDQCATANINALKLIFSCHGIPQRLRSDNGPQFACREFKQFSISYGFEHTTSSPHLPNSNGEAERAVETVKHLWKKASDKYLALLDYRTTPLDGINLSPAQLLMGRRPRNTLPSAREILAPSPYNKQEVQFHFRQEKKRQKYYYDTKSGAKDLPPLQSGDEVRMAPLPGSNSWLPATVLKHHETPRSYTVTCGGRSYRRNRRHLRQSTRAANAGVVKEGTSDCDWPQPQYLSTKQSQMRPQPDVPTPSSSNSSQQGELVHGSSPTVQAEPEQCRTRSGRLITAPKKLDL
jgi:hypothetical protein